MNKPTSLIIPALLPFTCVGGKGQRGTIREYSKWFVINEPSPNGGSLSVLSKSGRMMML